MRRLLPPLNPLRMFDAAARHVSFTRAAEEMSVTQTAVSRQVAVLEAYLRVRLFERHNSELILTDAGRTYLDMIRPAFEAISQATEVARGQASNVLRLRVYLTFSLRWLLPRLSSFRAQHPSIEINLMTSMSPVDFDRDDVDISICHGDGKWPGVSCWQVFEDEIAPVCAPELMAAASAPRTPADLAGQTLLHSRNRLSDWEDWLHFACAGRELDIVHAGPTFETSSLLYEAARQKMGFAIGQMQLLKGEIGRGELVAPFASMRRRDLGYYLLHRAGRVEPKTAAFRTWLLREAGAEIETPVFTI